MKTILPTDSQSMASRAQDILDDSGILDNPYFLNLDDHSTTLKQFQDSQIQFYFAVLHFARPMMALVSRMPDPQRRLDILHNVVEEHGDFDNKAFHETTFRAFLNSIGVEEDPRKTAHLGSEVLAFNRCLDGVCNLGSIEEAVGCLGIIEFAFADISAFIGRMVVDRGWIKSNELVHYKLHSEIDKRHAQELFDAISLEWNDPQVRAQAEDGMRLGVYIFNQLYLSFDHMSKQEYLLTSPKR